MFYVKRLLSLGSWRGKLDHHSCSFSARRIYAKNREMQNYKENPTCLLMTLTLTRKCYQQAFSSFQRDVTVELYCEFSSLLIKKRKCWKPRQHRTKKHQNYCSLSCHRHSFSKFPVFFPWGESSPTIKMQNVSSSSGFFFHLFIGSDNFKHTFLLHWR